MLYWIARGICRVALFVLRRWEVYGAENLPKDGPVVVASNHVSYWDPVAVGSALNRQVFFMAKWELFKIPIFGPLIRGVGAFPVKRKVKDRSAIHRAIQLLKSGQVVGIFPEGTRSHTKDLLPPHTGMVMLASKADALILPVAVKGTRGVVGKIKVYIGKPMDIKDFSERGKKMDREKYVEISTIIMEEIKNLLKS